jgi:hypothetical protein
MISEKRLAVIYNSQLYQKTIVRAYDKKVHPREFKKDGLVQNKIIIILGKDRSKGEPNYQGKKPFQIEHLFYLIWIEMISLDLKTLMLESSTMHECIDLIQSNKKGNSGQISLSCILFFSLVSILILYFIFYS